ncbi:MAG: hypothetical protein MK194_01945 [Roseibacillus sp.]|nr:hypothetical protein [Roseibacillus sp.]
MNIKYLPILAFAVGIGIATTSARHRSFGDGKLPEILEQFDLNEDGKIDEEERQAAREARRAARAERRAERIAEFDTDGDGELSDEEKEAAREARREALQAKREEKFAEIAGEDGCLDPGEFAALPPFEDKDPERVAGIFARLDADEGGCVSLEEFTARLRHQGRRSRPSRDNNRRHRCRHHHGRDREGGDDEGGDDEGGDDEGGDDEGGDDEGGDDA